MARDGASGGAREFRPQAWGWRGPVSHIDVGDGDWGKKLADVPALSDVEPWHLGVVLQLSKDKAVIGLEPGKLPNGTVDAGRKTIELPVEGVKWAFDAAKLKTKAKASMGVNDVLSVGDVVYVSPPTELDPPVREVRETPPGRQAAQGRAQAHPRAMAIGANPANQRGRRRHGPA